MTTAGHAPATRPTPGFGTPQALGYCFTARRRERRKQADIAQLVERNLAKVEVASSSLVVRSERSLSWFDLQRWSGREARQRTANPSTRVQIPSPPRAIGAAVARFLDTEEVTGSNPVSPTTATPQVWPRSLSGRRGLLLCRPSATRSTRSRLRPAADRCATCERRPHGVTPSSQNGRNAPTRPAAGAGPQPLSLAHPAEQEQPAGHGQDEAEQRPPVVGRDDGSGGAGALHPGRRRRTTREARHATEGPGGLSGG